MKRDPVVDLFGGDPAQSTGTVPPIEKRSTVPVKTRAAVAAEIEKLITEYNPNAADAKKKMGDISFKLSNNAALFHMPFFANKTQSVVEFAKACGKHELAKAIEGNILVCISVNKSLLRCCQNLRLC